LTAEFRGADGLPIGLDEPEEFGPEDFEPEDFGPEE
jgi:hypothetical protein